MNVVHLPMVIVMMMFLLMIPHLMVITMPVKLSLVPFLRVMIIVVMLLTVPLPKVITKQVDHRPLILVLIQTDKEIQATMEMVTKEVRLRPIPMEEGIQETTMEEEIQETTMEEEIQETTMEMVTEKIRLCPILMEVKKKEKVETK